MQVTVRASRCDGPLSHLLLPGAWAGSWAHATAGTEIGPTNAHEDPTVSNALCRMPSPTHSKLSTACSGSFLLPRWPLRLRHGSTESSSAPFLDGPSLPVAHAGVGGILPARHGRCVLPPGLVSAMGWAASQLRPPGSISTATSASPRDTQQDDRHVDPPSRVMSGSG